MVSLKKWVYKKYKSKMQLREIEQPEITFELFKENQVEVKEIYDSSQKMKVIELFMEKFANGEKVIVKKKSNEKTIRKYTWENAQHRYDHYLFRQCDDISDESYEKLKMAFVNMQLYDQLTFKSFEEHIEEIVERL